MIRRAFLLSAPLALPWPALADRGPPRPGLGLAQVVELIAGRYRGRLLSVAIDRPTRRERSLGARTVFRAEYLTPDDNLLVIRMDGDSGRFLSVEGVGQSAARIRP